MVASYTNSRDQNITIALLEKTTGREGGETYHFSPCKDVPVLDATSQPSDDGRWTIALRLEPGDLPTLEDDGLMELDQDRLGEVGGLSGR